MTKRENEKQAPLFRQSRSDDSIEPGASAPGDWTDHGAQSPAGATSLPTRLDVAPAWLHARHLSGAPGATAPGYTSSHVPGLESRCMVEKTALVDYADGELSGEEARTVEQHVNECPECRTRVAALRKSLSIAQEFWRNAAVEAKPIARPMRRAGWKPVAAIVSSAAALLIAGWWITSGGDSGRDQSQPVVVEAPPLAAIATAKTPAKWDDLEATIARQVRSARLAASARVLADDPNLKTHHDNAQRYLAEAFGSTDHSGAGNIGTEQEI